MILMMRANYNLVISNIDDLAIYSLKLSSSSLYKLTCMVTKYNGKELVIVRSIFPVRASGSPANISV